MGEYKTSKLESSLKKKGFELEVNDHRYYYFYWENEKLSTIFTYVSHSETNFNEFLLNQRRKQLCLNNKQQMIDFINCPMSKENYKEHLIKIKKINED
jgi:hypothetical protein